MKWINDDPVVPLVRDALYARVGPLWKWTSLYRGENKVHLSHSRWVDGGPLTVWMVQAPLGGSAEAIAEELVWQVIKLAARGKVSW